MITQVITRKGTPMAFANLKDSSGKIELVIFPDTFKSIRAKLDTVRSVVIKGQLAKSGRKSLIVCENIRFDKTRKRKKWA